MRPRRILVKGGSGAGKTTLAATLSQWLCVPHVELDALHHGPNWQAATAAELRERVTRMLDDERGWVVDGNYDSKLDTLVLDRTELVVWLDLSLPTKLLRLLRRTSRRWISGEELWNGNRETWMHVLVGWDSLFVWAVRTHFRHARRWPERFAGRSVVRLRTAREVRAWLVEFKGEHDAEPRGPPRAIPSA